LFYNYSMKKKLPLLLFAIAILAAGYFFAMRRDDQDIKSEPARSDSQSSSSSISAPNQSASASSADSSSQSFSSSSSSISGAMNLDAPFIVQAPFGNWSDPVFQNACEEASIVMAMGWVNETETITPQDAKIQIQEIVSFENRIFGYSTDTDVFDMQKIFNQYFHYQSVLAKENVTLSDIKDSLSQGNLVIVPAFGQALHNPNYTAPGPIAHMLVITGYDPAAKEFITNDPGTRKGSGYRYDENVLFDAIWKYPSGPDAPAVPAGNLKKAMLIIGK